MKKTGLIIYPTMADLPYLTCPTSLPVISGDPPHLFPNKPLTLESLPKWLPKLKCSLSIQILIFEWSCCLWSAHHSWWELKRSCTLAATSGDVTCTVLIRHIQSAPLNGKPISWRKKCPDWILGTDSSRDNAVSGSFQHPASVAHVVPPSPPRSLPHPPPRPHHA